MKFFLGYLRTKRKTFISFALFFIVFAVSFLLYRIDIGIILYPTVLCFFVGLLITAIDFISVKKRYDRITGLENLTSELTSLLPDAETLTEDAYRQVVLSLVEGQRILAEHEFVKFSNMTDYYTVWVHQIKTPIASMRITLQNEDSALSRKLLNDLNRIEAYTEMVLTYIRLDSDSTDYVIKSTSIDEVMRQSVKKFSGDFIGKKLSLDFDLPEMTVLTDEKWIAFVFEQIISNAVKYTQSGGISIYAEGNTVCIKDTGIGIAGEDLPRIFENGFTGFNGRTNKKASGIGLYLCRRICSRLGHVIEIESEVSVGTTVKIRFNDRKIDID